MKNIFKKICLAIVATILVMWVWNQMSPHQQSDTQIDTIEFSEDINDFFAGGTTIYAVWVKEV